MNKIILLLFLLFMTIFSTSEEGFAQSMPKIGDIWQKPLDSANLMYLPAPLDFKPKISFKFKDIKFDGAVNNNRVVSLSTTDINFEINGIKYIGKPLSFFKNKNKIKLILGWGRYLPIAEGWFAGFDMNAISDSSKVLFVFQIDNFS